MKIFQNIKNDLLLIEEFISKCKGPGEISDTIVCNFKFDINNHSKYLLLELSCNNSILLWFENDIPAAQLLQNEDQLIFIDDKNAVLKCVTSDQLIKDMKEYAPELAECFGWQIEEE